MSRVVCYTNNPLQASAEEMLLSYHMVPCAKKNGVVFKPLLETHRISWKRKNNYLINVQTECLLLNNTTKSSKMLAYLHALFTRSV